MRLLTEDSVSKYQILSHSGGLEEDVFSVLSYIQSVFLNFGWDRIFVQRQIHYYA